MVSVKAAHQIRNYKAKKQQLEIYKGIFHEDHLPATVGMFGFIIAFSLLSLQFVVYPFLGSPQRTLEQLPIESQNTPMLSLEWQDRPFDYNPFFGETVTIAVMLEPNSHALDSVDFGIIYNSSEFEYLGSIPNTHHALDNASIDFSVYSPLFNEIDYRWQKTGMKPLTNGDQKFSLIQLMFKRLSTQASQIQFLLDKTGLRFTNSSEPADLNIENFFIPAIDNNGDCLTDCQQNAMSVSKAPFH